jgi:hypothetical protein
MGNALRELASEDLVTIIVVRYGRSSLVVRDHNNNIGAEKK